MSTKVSDLTIEEFEERIKDAIRKVLHEEDILADDFAEELKARIANPTWLSHEEVWKEE